MDVYNRTLATGGIVFAVLLMPFLLWFALGIVGVGKEREKEYEDKVATHYVEVHFRDGNVKRFDKNVHIEVANVKEHVYYILRPSGTTIQFEAVEYAEIKENEKGH